MQQGTACVVIHHLGPSSSSKEPEEPVVFPGILPLGQLAVGAEPGKESPCGLYGITSSEYWGAVGLEGAGFATFLTETFISILNLLIF